MKIKEILDDFANYINYNPNQKTFQVFSNELIFHNAGEKIEQLLSGYDPSGILAVLYARTVFMEGMDNLQFRIKAYLEHPEIVQEIERAKKIYDKLYSPEVDEAAREYLDFMNDLVLQVSGMPMIGNRDLEEEQKVFFESVAKVTEDLDKCHIDTYQNSRNRVGEINKFHTRILVFERMADCLLQVEKMPDAIYFCYIRQFNTADGYFAFVIKSCGTIFSVNDRIDEEYIGQHAYSRNGRWTEAHADKLFPYDKIFRYDGHDYKGYASRYYIDDEKLDFMNLGAEVYQPILVAMIILKNRWENKRVPGEPVYLNSFFKRNYLEEHPGTDLMVLSDSSIAEWSQKYQCGIDPDMILSGEYNKRFKMPDIGTFWVNLYGDGFKPDFSKILTSIKPESLLEDNDKKEYYSEFIGRKEKMDREVYREVRIQLANYILKKMMEEYDAWGEEKIRSYIKKKCIEKKDKFLDLACEAYFWKEYPEFAEKKKEYNKRPEHWDPFLEKDYSYSRNDLVSRIMFNSSERIDKDVAVLNKECVQDLWGNVENLLDDKTNAKCTVICTLTFKDWREIETFLDCEQLPKIFQGWRRDASGIGYNGNSLLSTTDAVGDLTSPLYSKKRPDGKGLYKSFYFGIAIGFSKTSWRQLFEAWMLKNGYENFLLAKKAEAKQKREQEKEKERKQALIPKIPYGMTERAIESSKRFSRFDNKEQLLAEDQFLYELNPKFTMDIEFSANKKRVTRIYTKIPVKGNAEVLRTLTKSGWTEYYREKRSGAFSASLTKYLSN